MFNQELREISLNSSKLEILSSLLPLAEFEDVI